MSSVVREPAVAGQFYPGTRSALEKALVNCYLSPLGPGELPTVADRLLGSPVVLMVPHAGYVYSGPIAAWGYAELARRGRPSAAILLGPNHRGRTLASTIETEGLWRTPLGDTPIASSLARAIHNACPAVEDDRSGGKYEHSLEVQLPFLQHLYGPEIPIVPIMVSSHQMVVLRAIASAIAAALPIPGVVVCSTDMTHFEPAYHAQPRDALALEAVKAIDAEELARVVREHRITMCGWAATAIGLLVARELGLETCHLLRYGHSGHVTGDDSSVVAYASALIE